MKPQFTAFVGDPDKKQWRRENYICGAYIKQDLFRNHRKFNAESWQTTYPGMRDRGFTVYTTLNVSIWLVLLLRLIF
jgi:hypothetical protein